MPAIIAALTKLLAGTQAAGAFGKGIIGGAFDKIAGGAVAKMFPAAAQQSAFKDMIVGKVMEGGNSTTVDDLIKFFPQQTSHTKQGQARMRGR